MGVTMLTISGKFFWYVQTDKTFDLLKSANVTLAGKNSRLIHALLMQPEKAKRIFAQFSQATAHKIVVFYQQSFVHGYVEIMVALLIVTLILFVWTLSLLRS